MKGLPPLIAGVFSHLEVLQSVARGLSGFVERDGVVSSGLRDTPARRSQNKVKIAWPRKAHCRYLSSLRRNSCTASKRFLQIQARASHGR